MRPKKEEYKPYYDSQMRHQYDSEDESMDFMKSKSLKSKQDPPKSKSQSKKPSQPGSTEKKPKTDDKKSKVLHKPEDLGKEYGSLHYEYSMPYHHQIDHHEDEHHPVDTHHEVLHDQHEMHFYPGMAPPYMNPQAYPQY